MTRKVSSQGTKWRMGGRWTSVRKLRKLTLEYEKKRREVKREQGPALVRGQGSTSGGDGAEERQKM